MSMKPTHPSDEPAYGHGYARGRHAAKEHIPNTENPFDPGTPAHAGWNDGHYDEKSARRMEIARHSELLWS
jgi:hypothetical protein